MGTYYVVYEDGQLWIDGVKKRKPHPLILAAVRKHGDNVRGYAELDQRGCTFRPIRQRALTRAQGIPPRDTDSHEAGEG